MASSSQTYVVQKAVEVLDPACTECLAKGKECFQHFNLKSSKCNFCFVRKKPCHCPGPADSNVKRNLWSSSSAVPISRLITEGLVKWIRRISDLPPDLDAEGSDELDGEEVEVVNNPVGHQSVTSPSHLLPKDLKAALFPVPLEIFNQLLLPFLLPFLLHHQIPPTPGLP
ncbi:hypothetical protein O181_082668 [Austropuccinia psidii MF-1]|uniref:Uncharacterized protein n=1 Tax=Austropuccinia psidii MF-1 TaxID=1389203 RepID=A0A9Q3FS81_9BASI|nr:hypothetical protein [Austropuccinia psidii MF-1]